MRIGIDIGTSMTKAVLLDDGGAARAVRSSPTAMRRPAPGQYEHDLDEIVAGVLDLVADLPAGDVDLVAITGQGDGLWLLDAEGRPVRNAISWMDDRGAADCSQWSESGATAAIFAATGNATFPGAGAALLAFLARTEPESLKAAATATQCQHAVFQALTGVRIATRSAAMLGVFNPALGDYDSRALDLTGLQAWRHLLPDIAADPVTTAPLRPDLAAGLGLRAGTQIATGPYDLPAAAMGAGLHSPGDGLLILGTTLACLVHSDEVRPAGEPAGLTLCTGDHRGYLRAMPAMVGTAGLDWVLSMVGAAHSDLDGLLSASAPGAGGVAALPYLSPAGERAPFVDPAARAQFTGLSLATTRADLVRAYCEALAYAARHCFEAAGLTGSVTVCGGGAASEGLLAIMASALGRPVAAVMAPEVAADGAAVAAGGSAESDRRRRHVSRIVDPVPPDRMGCDGGYAAYLRRLAIEKDREWSARSHGDGHPQSAMVARPVPATTGDRRTPRALPHPAPAPAEYPAPVLAEYPAHPPYSARHSDTPIGGMW